MKFKAHETVPTGQMIEPATQPTIWALRKNVRAYQDNNPQPASGNTLYEHLFGYDPIRLVGQPPLTARREEHTVVTAENPNLNIINPKTNFAVMEIAADLPPESV